MHRLAAILLMLFMTGCAAPLYQSGQSQVINAKVAKDQRRPSVILVHGCGGPEPHSHWMSILDQHGLNSVLMDYIRPRGYASICDLNAPVSIDAILSELNDLVAWVSEQSWHQGGVFVMGFSFGGAIVNGLTDMDNLQRKAIPTNHLRKVKRVVSVYPHCGLGALGAQTSIPTQVHFGMQDYWTHHTLCMTERLDKGSYELIYHEGAMHGFDIPGTATHVNGVHRLGFHPRAYADMQRQVIRFLK